jgi:hypothetical protein
MHRNNNESIYNTTRKASLIHTTLNTYLHKFTLFLEKYGNFLLYYIDIQFIVSI